MTAKLRWLWARLDANYWFYPALFVVLSLVLAVAMLSLDRAGAGAAIEQYGPPLAATPESAHTMLQVIAGGMFGAAATVFSITIAAVAYASGTYGPRLLANFLEDKGNQFSLATLMGTFVYALAVLTSVRAGSGPADTGGFAPQVSLLCAYALTALSVGVIVYLLNHIPSSIRINHVLEDIGRRLLRDIRARFPHDGSQEEVLQPEGGEHIASQRTGYIQMIDFAGLSRLARKRECRLALQVRTGDFIHRGRSLVRLCAGEGGDDLPHALDGYFTVGSVRTPDQDPQFLIDELVEIGLRALSPGINDPFTAITVLQWLGAAIAELGARNLAKEDGMLDGARYVFPLPDDFGHFLARSFAAMRSAVATSPTAARVMFETLANAASAIDDADRCALLRREADDLLAQAKLALAGPDLAMVESRHREAIVEMRR